jgi:predicted DNA-binding transcriptional regulator AlpA
MKNQTISGNRAASPLQEQSIPSSLSLSEPWVTLRDVTRHFGMSRTTVWRNIYDHQMPCQPLRGHRLRFVISEIQQWLERTGRTRFAAIGRASTLAALKQAIAANPRFATLQIRISAPMPAPRRRPRKLSKNILKQSVRS